MARLNIKSSQSRTASDEQSARKIHLRRAHKKSHLGCQRCKERRIKCDEQFPICSQCKKAKFDCPYLFYTEAQKAEHIEKRNQAASASNLPINASNTSSGNKAIKPTICSEKDHPSLNSQQEQQPIKYSVNTVEASQPASIDNNYSDISSLPSQPSVPAQVTVTTSTSTAESPKFYAQNDYQLAMQQSRASTPTKNYHNSSGSNSPNSFTISFNGSHQPDSPRWPTSAVSPPSYSIFHKGMPIVERINQITDLQRRDLLGTVNLVRQGFETEIMRNAYSNWMSNTLALAFHHECLYHAVMAFSFGFQAVKTDLRHYRILSDKHRVIALTKFQSEIENVSPANTDALLGTSLILYWDAMYQVDTIYSYINMCRGLGAILEKVQINSSTTQAAICTTESLAQAIKSILYPRYSYAFFQELRSQIASLESYIQEDISNSGEEILREYEFLVYYTNKIANFLEMSGNYTYNSIYDPNILYSYLREWITNFPCLAFSLDLLSSNASIVLYAYYDATSRALDAIFPEVRYLFQFSFIGPIDLVGIESAAFSVTRPDALEKLEYPLRLVSFFKKRTLTLSTLFIASDPLLMNSSGPLYRSRQPDLVLEKYVYSFKHPFDFQEHMPSFNPNVPNLMDASKPKPMSSTSNNGLGFGQLNTSLPPLFNGKNENNSNSDSSSQLPPPLPALSKLPSNSTPAQLPEDIDLRLPPLDKSGVDVDMSSSEKPPILPPLSSLSMGCFKTYFDDRMDILEHFAPHQKDIC